MGGERERERLTRCASRGDEKCSQRHRGHAGVRAHAHTLTRSRSRTHTPTHTHTHPHTHTLAMDMQMFPKEHRQACKWIHTHTHTHTHTQIMDNQMFTKAPPPPHPQSHTYSYSILSFFTHRLGTLRREVRDQPKALRDAGRLGMIT